MCLFFFYIPGPKSLGLKQLYINTDIKTDVQTDGLGLCDISVYCTLNTRTIIKVSELMLHEEMISS